MKSDLPPELVERLDGLRPVAGGFVARCPAHDDHKPSLSVTIADTGRVLLHCHAGCEHTAVTTALGIDPSVLRGEQTDGNEWTPHGDAIATYDYRDEAGKTLFQVLRTVGKHFPQRRPDPTTKSGWAWKLGDVRRVPYRLPELLEAVREGKPVWIVEGEKDVHTLERHGQAATCNPGGAGKWRPEFAEFFHGARVTICADKDEPGQRHARHVADTLRGVATAVRIVEAAGLHKDITDHLAAGLELRNLAVTVHPEEASSPRLAPDVYELLEMSLPDYDWLVPGLLERTDRLMLTGYEGWGKTTLVRQTACTIAAGLHPFKHTASFDPLRVLVVDAENSIRQNRRAYRPLVRFAHDAGRPIPRGNLRLEIVPEGVDLTRDDDAAWLLERVTAHQPDVLFLGPLYRCQQADIRDEPAARATVAAIDRARVRGQCAVVVEAHSGHGDAFTKNRSVRPIGSSLFLRWPEFGIGLRPNADTDAALYSPLDVGHWRGQRDNRVWPERIRRGRSRRNDSGLVELLEWPWLETSPDADRW